MLAATVDGTAASEGLLVETIKGDLEWTGGGERSRLGKRKCAELSKAKEDHADRLDELKLLIADRDDLIVSKQT